MVTLSRTDASDLLTALHEGAFDEPLWATFLARLKLRVQADYAGILFRSNSHAGVEVREFYAGRAGSRDIQRRYLAGLYRLDPLPYELLRPERVYTMADFIDMSRPDHAKFHQEILKPTGLSHSRVIRVTTACGTDAWCVISREESDFPASTSALLSALAPHLRISVRNLATVQRERGRAAISSDMAHRLNFGWMTLDATGRVVDLDSLAGRLLQHSAVLKRTRTGRLLPAHPPADRMLSEILRKAASQASIVPRLIHLWDEPWFDMLAVGATAKLLHQQSQAVVTIYIRGDAGTDSSRCEHLMTLFNLSSKEAELALALSRGRTITEAASEIGLTIQSARTYSKRVYAKTFTRGQSDLIRLILTSVIALA